MIFEFEFSRYYVLACDLRWRSRQQTLDIHVTLFFNTKITKFFICLILQNWSLKAQKFHQILCSNLFCLDFLEKLLRHWNENSYQLFLEFSLSCLASRWFATFQKNHYVPEKSHKFMFCEVVFYQNNYQRKSYKENACFITCMSFNCTSNSKSNSHTVTAQKSHTNKNRLNSKFIFKNLNRRLLSSSFFAWKILSKFI